MRHYEFIQEAINITHYEDIVRDTINAAIIEGLGELTEFQGKWKEEEERFNAGYLSALSKKLLQNFGIDTGGEETFRYALIDKLYEALEPELGTGAITDIDFLPMKDGTLGYVDGSKLRINETVLNKIAKKVIEKVTDIVNDNYGEGDLAAGLWEILESFSNNDRYYKKYVLDVVRDQVDAMSSTIIHELVHIIQHKKQRERGRDDIDYRSYLGKKSEFHNLARARSDATTKPSSAEDERYYQLYHASPQEITAFSNQAALNMIRDFGLSDVGLASVEEFNDAVSAIDARSVIDYIESIIAKKYRKPEDKREYAVFKRYVKQTYQALQDYIHRQRERLKARDSQSLNERAIGKKMGHDLYVHKDYVGQTAIPQEAFDAASSKLPQGYDYTAVKYNSKDGSFSFIQSPDFDTADEPTVGVSLKVSADGAVKRTNPPSDPWIWHNKWMWVGDDYQGFDVERAKERSKHWKNYIGVNKDVSSRIGKKSYWDTNIVPNL